MNTDTFTQMIRTTEETIDRLVHDYNIKVNELSEKQVVDLICQIVKSGDIVRYVVHNPEDGLTQVRQAMVYQPFRDVERLKAKNELLKRALAHLVNLDDDPHPGLFTWCEAYQNAIKEAKEALLA